jgi:hypothetical protein
MNRNELQIKNSEVSVENSNEAEFVNSENTLVDSGSEHVETLRLPFAFKVKRMNGYDKKEEWDVMLDEKSAEFTQIETGESIEIAREKANIEMKFSQDFSLFGSKSLIVTHLDKNYTFQLDINSRSRLLSWLPKFSAEELKLELRKWGVGLILLGLIHIFLQGFLDPLWGVLICVVGILNLIFTHRLMFLVNGACLILAGILNASVGGGWKFFGILQLIWGIQEMIKINRYE